MQCPGWLVKRVESWIAAQVDFFPPWKTHASCGKLFGMGNRDARRREVKKPKKKTPKLAPPSRYVHPIATPSVSTPAAPQKNPPNSQ
jgi:hypothetical protein